MFGFKKKKPTELERVKDELEQEIENLVGEEAYSEFKKFAFKKNMIELAIAFMLGAALQKIVTSISDNLIMPVVNYATNAAGTDWREWVVTPIQGITLELGAFVGSFVDFVLLAIVLFLIWYKIIAPMTKKEEKIKVIDTMECPHCYERIFYKSKRCKFCTQEIKLMED